MTSLLCLTLLVNVIRSSFGSKCDACFDFCWTWRLLLGVFYRTGAQGVTVLCWNCADILRSGTCPHVASLWLARLRCWAPLFQGMSCPPMDSSTWQILSPRGKNIQRGASLGEFNCVANGVFCSCLTPPSPNQWTDVNDELKPYAALGAALYIDEDLWNRLCKWITITVRKLCNCSMQK